MTRAALAVVAASLATLASCSRAVPEKPPAPVAPSELTANSQAISVPYGGWLLIRDGQRQVALSISPQSPRGDAIGFEWVIDASGSGRFDDPAAQRGQGATAEQLGEGHITLPGLRLTWSRGSVQKGWIYWPENGHGLGVYSLSWPNLDDVTPDAPDGKWLEAEMFRK